MWYNTVVEILINLEVNTHEKISLYFSSFAYYSN